MSAKPAPVSTIPTDTVEEDEEDFVLIPNPGAAGETTPDEKTTDGSSPAQAADGETLSEPETMPAKVIVADTTEQANGATQTQASEKPVESVPTMAPDSFDSFLATISPIVDDLISKIDANPQHIPTLIKHYQETLSSRNWGITILQPEDPAPIGAIGGLATHLPPPMPAEHKEQEPQEEPARSQPSSSSAVRLYTWRSLICDGCEKHRFSGPRYKCTVCTDFDLCEKCHSSLRILNRHGHSSFDKHTDASSLWVGVTCDGCNRNSFSGTKWVCAECPNFDLCEKCYESRVSVHIPWHTFRPQFLPAVHSKLLKMGFTDKYRNHHLLEDLNGNLEQVVAALVADNQA
ncbi:hypothetical protein HDU86_007220 [Geranomyces michiganensis]|nr:hypothetical protein HDU86_007220 [Geranomyces michiganensis]